MTDVQKGLSHVSSEHTLNDRQSSLQELPKMTSSHIQNGKFDKNIFYQYLNNASNTDLHSQKDNIHASQSELSNGALNAIELVNNPTIVNGANGYVNNMNFSLNSKMSEHYNSNGHKASVFNRVAVGANVGRENAFSVSGQKVVHFKDSTTDQLSSEERKLHDKP